MKSILFLLILASLLGVSCGNSTSNNTVATNSRAVLPANSSSEAVSTSYAGKTSTELDAQGIHNCGGHILGGSAYDDNALYTTTYAATEAQCENGENHISLEQNLSHDASGKANMQVLADLIVTESKPQQQQFVTKLSVNGGAKAYYAVEYVEDGSQTVTQVGKLWRVNTATNVFEEVPVPAGFSFPHPYNDLVD